MRFWQGDVHIVCGKLHWAWSTTYLPSGEYATHRTGSGTSRVFLGERLLPSSRVNRWTFLSLPPTATSPLGDTETPFASNVFVSISHTCANTTRVSCLFDGCAKDKRMKERQEVAHNKNDDVSVCKPCSFDCRVTQPSCRLESR